MPASDIVIKGAREHNLQSVDLILPRNKLICLTGVSGSGKSSLAFDTVYAEGQRRYVESLSSFARQFLGQMPKPDVDFIGGLSPSISISQKSSGTNPRSTVGTITEIYDYLRVLYTRVGDGHCPTCHRPISAQTREQIIQRILEFPEGSDVVIMAPVIRGQKGEHRDLCEDLLKQGYMRARIDGQIYRLTDNVDLDRQMRHDIEVVIDRVTLTGNVRARLAEAVDAGLKIGDGNLVVNAGDSNQGSPEGTPAKAKRRSSRRVKRQGVEGDVILSASYACTHCGVSFDPPSPQLFSFNSPRGMCLECDGLGEAYTFDPELLIPDAAKSLKQGCFELLGNWRSLSRWRRHIYQGVADTVERMKELEPGTLLDTPWGELPSELQSVWLWGAGTTHITFTWRGGSSPMMYGGTFEGIVPELLSKYRNSKSRMHLQRLEKYMRTQTCPECHGERLNAQARAVTISTDHNQFADRSARTLPELCDLPIVDVATFFSQLKLDSTRAVIAESALKEIRGRLGFLTNVGLDYLTLGRTAPTLSGGESQRIRLAGQIGCGLVGVLYILDEPSIGLHPRDNDRLLDTLAQLRDVGNTVLVVEHDEDTMRHADHVIDFGPGPGVRGGEVVAAGPLDEILRSPRSVTGEFLSGKRQIEIPQQRRAVGNQQLRIRGARQNNLRGIDVDIPLGAFVCVTGVSGSGKSSLVNDILVEALRRDLNHGNGEPGEHDSIEGLEFLDKMISIDQTPIGRTPRSNPGTYIKVFDEIRKLYTQLPDARRRGYKPGRFSFNVKGGRCEACEGNGSNRLEMDFLADVWVTCPVCNGHRFSRETLTIKFKDKSIADILEMDIQQLLELFENIPGIQSKLQTLHDVGLDYLKLGQPSPTLSGGEAQRIKLARELVKKSTGQTLYLLDEPTTGLHFADIELLLKVLHDFADAGNTVLVVEHNLDVIKTADWIIDLGPEGGNGGGTIIATGTPEDLAQIEHSHTGRALHALFRPRRTTKKARHRRSSPSAAAQLAKAIEVQGARQHNLKDVNASLPRDKMSVFCGPSGSGKSSLAMDTIYAEGQRRYVESLSSYARQFVSQMQKPQLEHIEGLSPAIAIEQQNQGQTPRSTVGTSTEIYDYLRILMARLGDPYCPDCDRPIGTQTVDQVTDKVMDHPEGTRMYLMAPLNVDVGQEYEAVWQELRAHGYLRVRIDGKTYNLDEVPEIDRRRRHRVEAVVDRIIVRKASRSRIAESVEAALGLGRGVMHIAVADDDVDETSWHTDVHSQHLVCKDCGRSFEAMSPHRFSFNSHLGWCTACEGLGTQTGANPAALLNDSGATLADGALLLWPNLDRPLAKLMLEALARKVGLPLDVPFSQMSSRERRFVFHGTGETWIEVSPRGMRKKDVRPLFRFQFKGLYPALEEAAKLSPALRSRLMYLVDEVECSACGGSRLRDDASAVRFRGRTIDQLCRQPLGMLNDTVQQWKLDARERKIAGELIREIRSRLQFLIDVGLEYLSLGRPANSLSGGEAQRIRLASQLGSGLCGVLYVLDEPTIGLHPRDNRRLLAALHKLRDLGNTLVLVEHDREVIEGSDYLLDFGPQAGKNGGEIVATGTPRQISRSRTSVTGPYLSGTKAISIPENRRPVTSPPSGTGVETAKTNSKPRRRKESAAIQQPPVDWLVVRGARHHNLKHVDVAIPLGRLTAVTGPSGSGKSSLIEDILYPALAARLHRANLIPGGHEAIEGLELINKVIRVDQQPLGNSPTSNPATYTGLFEHIRHLFSQLPESRLRGYTQRRFSFNVPGGRCEACEGAGQLCIEMHFLPDVWITCDTCNGARYNPETLTVKYRGHSIADVLEMTCGEAFEVFHNIPKVRRILQTLCDVGLDYLTLGQAAPTLSGGEAQRVKLAAELARPDTGQTLYLLDEPTTGLHFDDLAKLLEVMQRLVDLGNTVVVIEHNLDVIKTADWVIDMGPEAGDLGGMVVVAGTPETLVDEAAQRLKKSGAKATKKSATTKPRRTTKKKDGPRGPVTDSARSYTGEALMSVLADSPRVTRTPFDPETLSQEQPEDVDIRAIGQDTKMPWETRGRRWHVKERVGRRGEPCRWEGRILEEVVDRIHELGDFSETNWGTRTIVEIAGKKKSDGWFMHAITGEAWLLKLKFRVTKSTFKREELLLKIPLKTLNQMDELPIYGNEPRLKCKNLRGPWQEVEIRVHSWDEINVPGFWEFLEAAIEGFQKHVDRVAENIEDVMPWRKLGERWHLSRKGFPPGKRVEWEPELLETLCLLVSEALNGGKFVWHNQQVVHTEAGGESRPWASIFTKRPQHVELVLTSPKGAVAQGRVAEFGQECFVDIAHDSHDLIKMKFQKIDELQRDGFAEFLKEHAALT
ncbi:MAG: excinuclease ABC subunit UvrA [Planctomycetales bacterium]|nr:excinuclease ABC subunit UvrA [Planctomycetales bacterium]